MIELVLNKAVLKIYKRGFPEVAELWIDLKEEQDRHNREYLSKEKLKYIPGSFSEPKKVGAFLNAIRLQREGMVSLEESSKRIEEIQKMEIKNEKN